MRRWFVLAIAMMLLAGGVLAVGDFGLRLATQPGFVPLTPATGPAEGRMAVLALASSDCTPVARPEAARPVSAYLPAADLTAQSAYLADCGRVGRVYTETMALDPASGTVAALDFVASELPGGLGRLDAGFVGHDVFRVLHLDPSLSAADLGRIFTRQASRARFADSLTALLAAHGGQGLCIDLSAHGGFVGPAFRAMTATLRQVTSARGMDLCMIGRIDATTWAEASALSRFDRVLALAPQGDGALGTGADGRFGTGLMRVRDAIGDDRLEIALDPSATHWQSGGGRVDTLPYALAMQLAADNGAPLAFAPDTATTHAQFLDARRQLHQLVVPDAATTAAQLAGMPRGLGVSLWPIGYEDPSAWPLFDGTPPAEALNRPIDLSDRIAVPAEGIAALAMRPSTPGRRSVTLDADGRPAEATYTAVPLAARLDRAAPGTAPEVMLQVVGLPAARDRDAVFDLLRRAGARAVFLVSRHDLLHETDGLRRAVADGHLLALSEPAAGGARLDEMLLSVRTGMATRLLRPDDLHDALPATRADGDTLVRRLDRGLVLLPPGRPTPRDPAGLHDFVAGLIDTGQGTSVVTLLPVAGRERITPAPLASLLAELSSSGFVLADPERLLEATGVALMTPLESRAPRRDAAAFALMRDGGTVLSVVFFVLLVLAFVRSAAFLVLAVLRRPRKTYDPTFLPQVTVIVPAYNEAAVIANCLASLLGSHYRNLRIIVVDDGSTDATAEIVQDIAATEPRIRLISQPNGGKWAALDTALERTTSPIFVVADADSTLRADAIGWLVQQFRIPAVGAVAGIVEVGNRVNLLTQCQSLEYIVSQNVMRRAYETFHGILVVPGAIGAWRTEAVRRAGGFSGESITEDADLTVAVHRAGYRIVLQEQARAATEAPETVPSFMRQRLRWALGMHQIAWKHRHAIPERHPVGYVSILDAIWFSVLTCLLSPLVDLILVGILLRWGFGLVTGADSGISVLGTQFLLGYFLLTVIDILNTLLSLYYERRWDWRLVVLTPLLRFGYRQLLYISTMRALWRVLTGRLAKWQKLDRTGRDLIHFGLGTRQGGAVPGPAE